MKCRIVELGERDAWWPDRYLFEGLEGEMIDDGLFEYDETTGWARGYFDCDKNISIAFPVFLAEVRIKEL